VNEAAVDFMQMDSPIDKKFSIWQAEGKIIGIVKNFHSLSLYNEICPVVMTLIPFMPPTQCFIRIKPENIKTSLAIIENEWNEAVPGYPFQYEFLDDAFRRQYTSEERIGTLFKYFSILAIFISCIGLFGLASFIARRRTKEIGLRKVLGASVSSIFFMLSKEFIKWIIIANVIAWPVAYYFMNKWLQDFAYRIEITWWMFALAGGIALVIALATISFQAVKAATANPVEALKYE
jgi:putative ABC transport system permease protein